jgi:hypothetical protein
MNTKSAKTCCPESIHAQIEYRSQGGRSVETFFSTNLKYYENRKFLHDMLDEWMNKRNPGEGPDHFIVYGKWPAEDSHSVGMILPKKDA